MPTLKICMLGGTGFVGRSICMRLAALGHRIVIISRRRERHRDLLVLPTLSIVNGDVHDPEVLRAQFQGSDAVINLVGILNEKGRDGSEFRRVHTELPEKVIGACRSTGVRRLLHMSALNADPSGPSHYLRTKGLGENLVHQAANSQTQVTSFRPSVIFGPHDSFTNRFAALLRHIPLAFPLACPDARLQPVYVGDVSVAFTHALRDIETFGKRYNLCGPKSYSLFELVSYIASLVQLKRHIIRLSDWQSRLQANVMEYVPGKPFSRDNYESLQQDSVCSEKFPQVFDLVPGNLEEIAPTYLKPKTDKLASIRRRAGRGDRPQPS